MTADERVSEILDLVDAAVYADVFDAAVTLEELHRFSRVAIDLDELTARLRKDALFREVVVLHSASIVTLVGSERLADDFDKCAARAEHLRRRASRVSRVLRHAPFVREILLTGSVAAGAARRDADVDLLVLVADGRLGTVFALLGTVSRIVGRHFFCPNFYLSERNLAFVTQNVYVGHELGQARSVVGDVGALVRANPWLQKMFPNLTQPETAPVRPGSALQAILETALRGRLGCALEARARGLARARLRAHYGAVPPEIESELAYGVSLRFHASGVESSAPRRHAERRAALAERLLMSEGLQAGRSS
jgi:predicted nucleotidyltransferase